MNDINYKNDEIKEKTIEQCKDLQVMNLLSEINELKKEIVFYEKFLKEIDLKIERIQLYGYKNAD